MSKVYSFRLSNDNPREAQAREVIESWIMDGYSLRYVVTEALLNNLDNKNKAEDVISLLDQIKKMISRIENMRSLEFNYELEGIDISSSFMTAMKRSARSGLKSK